MWVYPPDPETTSERTDGKRHTFINLKCCLDDVAWEPCPPTAIPLHLIPFRHYPLFTWQWETFVKGWPDAQRLLPS